MIERKNYDDIINLPHHVSKNRKPMSSRDRAAQFSPFSALTGYDEAIQETARTVEKKKQLSENQAAILNEKLLILSAWETKPLVTIVYFKKDKRKAGGKYLTIEGKIKHIDEVERTLILQDGVTLSIHDVYDIKADIFAGFDLD